MVRIPVRPMQPGLLSIRGERKAGQCSNRPCATAYESSSESSAMGFVQDLIFPTCYGCSLWPLSHRRTGRSLGTWRAGSVRTSLCRDGGSMASGVRRRSSHNVSIAESFSWRVMSLSRRQKDRRSCVQQEGVDTNLVAGDRHHRMAGDQADWSCP